jgi:carbon starvation protein CstA
MTTERRGDTVIEYPNRDKSSSKVTKLIVTLLLLVTAVLMTIVTVGGWDKLQGAKIPLIIFILVFLLSAFFVWRWRSGMLPVSAALAIILLIFAAVSGPEWFARDKEGFDQPALDASILGMLTLLLVPVQVLVIGFSLSGFRQNWSTEIERRPEDDDRREEDDRRSHGGAAPAPA